VAAAKVAMALALTRAMVAKVAVTRMALAKVAVTGSAIRT